MGLVAPLASAALLLGAGWLVRSGGARPEHRPLLRPDQQQQEFHRQQDARAHELLDGFMARAFDPSRDGPIRTAELSVTVSRGLVSGRYTVAFDASRRGDEQVRVVAREPGPGADDEFESLARRAGVVALRGGIHAVLLPVPPAPLAVTGGARGPVVSTDSSGDRPGVSYAFDDRGLVVTRGKRSKPPEVWNYLWAELAGRWVLQSAGKDDGSWAVRYTWVETDPPRMTGATVSDGERRTTIRIDWTRTDPAGR
ncbi:MAG: hypothetical protein HMLKMBBP_02892 [Planctomycetes bacterium]|nr:hypothetical protein [Planctomycetota bacterium]